MPVFRNGARSWAASALVPETPRPAAVLLDRLRPRAPRPQQLFDFAIYIFFLRFHLETPDTAHTANHAVFRSVAI